MAVGYLLLAVIGIVAFYYWYSSGDNTRRIEAIKRSLYGIPYFALMFLAGSIIGGTLLLIWLLDTSWVFLTGREGFASDSHAQRLWDWRDRNMRWLVYGEGPGPKFIP